MYGLDAWITNVPEDDHRSECEDKEYYKCPACHELTHQKYLNYCPDCVRFIPRPDECICEDIEDVEPDWDLINKENRLVGTYRW